MDDEKLSGRIVIDTVLANMRQQVEELRYSKVVPSAYDVYLHPDDEQRFERLGHEIAAEAVRALQESLDALNRPSRLDGVRELMGRPRLPYKKVGPWLVRITRDPEGEVPRGRALVVSQIALADAEHYEGARTRRLATLSVPPGGRAESHRGGVDAPPPVPASPAMPASRTGEPFPAEASPRASSALSVEPVPSHEETRPVLAFLSWQDETGTHRFRITANETTLGRASADSTADVRLATLPDVSRIHARIRHEPATRRFTIEDLSLLGTTVDGQALVRGASRDLPPRAEIRLADAITLRFESGAERTAMEGGAP